MHRHHALFALLAVSLVLMGGKCTGGGGGGGAFNAYVWAICVPNSPGCTQATPSVDVEPLQTAVFGFYYTEEGQYQHKNNVHQLHFKVHWGQPVSGAVRNGALVPAPNAAFTDPVTGELVWDLLADRCQITADFSDTDNWASIHVHNLADLPGTFTPCSEPILDIVDGEVHPLYLATSFVLADALPGFTSANSFSELWATDENGVFVKAPRGGLSQLNVVAP
jgi:hypothetical protein